MLCAHWMVPRCPVQTTGFKTFGGRGAEGVGWGVGCGGGWALCGTPEFPWPSPPPRACVTTPPCARRARRVMSHEGACVCARACVRPRSLALRAPPCRGWGAVCWHACRPCAHPACLLTSAPAAAPPSCPPVPVRGLPEAGHPANGPHPGVSRWVWQALPDAHPAVWAGHAVPRPLCRWVCHGVRVAGYLHTLPCVTPRPGGTCAHTVHPGHPLCPPSHPHKRSTTRPSSTPLSTHIHTHTPFAKSMPGCFPFLVLAVCDGEAMPRLLTHPCHPHALPVVPLRLQRCTWWVRAATSSACPWRVGSL